MGKKKYSPRDFPEKAPQVKDHELTEFNNLVDKIAGQEGIQYALAPDFLPAFRHDEHVENVMVRVYLAGHHYPAVEDWLMERFGESMRNSGSPSLEGYLSQFYKK